MDMLDISSDEPLTQPVSSALPSKSCFCQPKERGVGAQEIYYRHKSAYTLAYRSCRSGAGKTEVKHRNQQRVKHHIGSSEIIVTASLQLRLAGGDKKL